MGRACDGRARRYDFVVGWPFAPNPVTGAAARRAKEPTSAELGEVDSAWNHEVLMANRGVKLTARLGVLLLASLGSAVGSSGTASAQVIVGADGTIYPSGPEALFVSSQPCRSYLIDVSQTEKLYPDVGRMLTSLAMPVDVTVSLQLKPDPPPWGERSSFYLTSISRRATGPHDARELCTSSTPGGYYEGVLIGFIPARNGFGRVDLRLSGDRELLLGFTRDAPPLRVGRQVVGKTRVRVYVDNIVDPDGDTSQRASRIEALP